MNVNYGLILMPAILKKYFGTSADVDNEIERVTRSSVKDKILERNTKKIKASKVIYQTRVLNFLIFVRNNILEYYNKGSE